jgi:GLPGLI family protein
MEKFILVIALALMVSFTEAQQQEGRIVYERTVKIQIQLNNEDAAMQNMIPKERKDRFECLFANNQSVWRAVEEEGDGGDMTFSSGGAEIRMIMPGSNDIIFTDFAKQLKVEQRELMTKTFVIQDSVKRLNWKITDESKQVLGFNCKKAIGQRTQKSYRVNMENGKMNREEVTDTLNIVAWFTNEIGGYNGPEQYQAQLPGTILEIDVNNGRTKFVATEVSKKVDVKEIKEPKGKKITAAEFALEREKMMKEMEANGGGSIQIRRN